MAAPVPDVVPAVVAAPAGQQPADGERASSPPDAAPADLAGRVLAMRQAGLPQVPVAAGKPIAVEAPDRPAPPRTGTDEPSARPDAGTSRPADGPTVGCKPGTTAGRTGQRRRTGGTGTGRHHPGGAACPRDGGAGWRGRQAPTG